MKILLLNPHVDARHKIAQALQARGHAVLFPGDVEEAWQMIQLHEANLDLVIVHREGLRGKDDGVKLVGKLKGIPQYYDLPIVLTSETWTDEDFATHQQGPQGVNAYMRWPFEADPLIQMIGEIFGAPAPAQLPTQMSEQSASLLTPEPAEGATVFAGTAHASAPSPDVGSFQLEEVSKLLKQSDAGAEGNFQLEAPIMPAESSPPPAAVTDASSEVALPTAMSPMPSLASLIHETPAAEPSFQIPEPSLQPFSPSGLSMPLGTAISRANSDPEPSVLNQEPSQEPSLMSKVAEPVATTFSESAPAAVGPGDEELAKEMAGEMPYLFTSASAKARRGDEESVPSPSAVFEQPIGDAVVPGGAAHSPDAETLKKYLLLREQDVAALSAQLRTARQEVENVKSLLREEHARNAELSHLAGDQKRRLDEFERVKSGELDSLRDEMDDLRFQARTKSDKARVLESQVREAATEIERLKERVRSDLRKIRIREKELENRLEIVKKDSEALLLTRENKIIELKRKVDLLEFNMDLLQDQFSKEKETSAKLRDRVAKAAQVVRVAGGLLDQQGQGKNEKRSEEDPAKEAS